VEGILNRGEHLIRSFGWGFLKKFLAHVF